MADMIVLTAAVLGVNLGIFAALYWQQWCRRRQRFSYRGIISDSAYRQAKRGNGSLASRLRWYTLR